MEAEVFDAFRSIGVADDKASAAAQALSKRDPDISILKSDVAVIKSDVAVLKSDGAVLKSDVAMLKSDVAVLKSEMLVVKWMVGFVGAMVASLVLRAFTH